MRILSSLMFSSTLFAFKNVNNLKVHNKFFTWSFKYVCAMKYTKQFLYIPV